jgi:hypothetical protein
MTTNSKTTISKTEHSARVDAVLRIKLDGAGPHDIADFAREQGWDVSTRQLQRYVAAAAARIRKWADENRDELLAEHVAKRRSLYARAVNCGDLSTALRILDSEAALLNLFPAAKPANPPAPPAAWDLSQASDEELAVLSRLAGRTAELTVTRTTATVRVTEEPQHHDASPLTLTLADDAPAGSGLAGTVPPEVPELPPVDVDPQ